MITQDTGAGRRTYLRRRRGDVHAEAPWTPFARVGRRLRASVRRYVDASGLSPGSRVVDLGCGEQPYRDELPDGVTYVGVDLPGNPKVDVVLGDDGTVDLPDGCADLVLSSQVLEHVDDPARYLRECRRLLRPGGSLVVSTHGLMYYHCDPDDYWRWTAPGLRRQVEAAGLRVVDMEGVLGLAAAAVQIFQDATLWKVPRLLRRPYVLLMQLAVALADRGYSDARRLENSLAIVARAVAPAAPESAS